MPKQYSTKPPVACKEALMYCDRSKVNEQSPERGDSNRCKPIRDQAQEMRAWMQGIVFLVYSVFAHENSILGEKPQVLLILPKPVVIIKHKHSVQESKWEFILKAFWKLSNEANDQVNLKHKQEKAANAFQKRAVLQLCQPNTVNISDSNCLQSSAVTIKKVHKRQHSDTAVLVTANQHDSGSGKGEKIPWLSMCCD